MRPEKASSRLKVPGSGSRFAIRGSARGKVVGTDPDSSISGRYLELVPKRAISAFVPRTFLGQAATYLRQTPNPEPCQPFFCPPGACRKSELQVQGSRFGVPGSPFAVRGSARGKIVGTDPDSSISAATYLLRQTPNPASHFSALPVRAEKAKASGPNADRHPKARPSPGITWPGPGDVRSLIDRAPGNPGSRSVSGLPSH